MMQQQRNMIWKGGTLHHQLIESLFQTAWTISRGNWKFGLDRRRLQIFRTCLFKGTFATFEIESYKCDADCSTPADIPRDRSSIESRDGSIQSYIQGVQVTRQELGHSDSASVEGTAEFMSNQENVNHCSHGEFCLLCLATGSSALASLLENTHALISPNTGSGERTADVVNPSEFGEDGLDGQDLTAANMVFDGQDLTFANMAFDQGLD